MQTNMLVKQVMVKRVQLFNFVSKAVICIYLANKFVSCEDISTTPELVSRRLSGDAVFFRSDDYMVCGVNDNLTYIVDERRCVSNEELLNDCDFGISPRGSNVTHRIYVMLSEQDNKAHFITLCANLSTAIAVITQRTQSQWSFSSFSDCHIFSLEVYRGSRSVTEINHEGFSVTHEGFIEIDKSNLMYNISELNGELYRMNISCSGEFTGCLFFKVHGISNITNAKFNSRVHGTFFDTDIDSDTVTTTTASVTLYLAVGLGSASSLIFVVTVTAVLVICLVCLRHHKCHSKKNESAESDRSGHKAQARGCTVLYRRKNSLPQCKRNISYKTVSPTHLKQFEKSGSSLPEYCEIKTMQA